MNYRKTVRRLVFLSLFAMGGITIQAQSVTKEFKETSLSNVLKEVEKQTGFSIMYNNEDLSGSSTVTRTFKKASIEEVLKVVLPQNLDFNLQDKMIVIYKKDGQQTQQKQVKQVTGRVVDDLGEPIIGVSVLEKGTSNGVITDMDGNYNISVSQDATIVFSYIGYITQEKKALSRELNVKLKENTEMLEEVVVVGYGVQKKSSVTGAISQVKSDDMVNRTITSPMQAMQGKTAGVTTFLTSGAPGESPAIRVRGVSSNLGSNPLYVVDGICMDGVSGIDPNDIESMEVLKDAATAAIYGAEAGNGVILITTKKGKAGQGSITYDVQLTAQSLSHKPRLLNANEYMTYMKEGGILGDDILSQWDGSDTDWLNESFETSYMQKHNLAFRGGNDNGNYYLSLSYLDNDGIVKGNADSYQRLTSVINAEYKIKPWMKVGTTNQIEKYNVQIVSTQNEYGSLFSCLLKMVPLTAWSYSPENLPSHMQILLDQGKHLLTDENGNYYGISPFYNCENYHPMIMRDNVVSRSSGFNVNGSIYTNFNPVKEFIFTSRFNYRLLGTRSDTQNLPYYGNAVQSRDYVSLSSSSSTTCYYQWENFANYTKTFNNAHTINAMLGMSFQEQSYQFVTGILDANGEDAVQYNNPLFYYLNYGAASAIKDAKGEKIRNAKMSYFGRMEYDYKNRYMLQALFRADAADLSRLSRSNRWGYFPAFSAGWSLSEEEFFTPLKNYVSHLKLRGSWGQNGSLSVLGGYPYSTDMVTDNFYSFYPGKSYTTSVNPATMGNDELTWETSEQWNIGIDTRFLQDRLTVCMDYYNKMTKDLIVANTTPSLIVGGNIAPINAGNITNKGFEFEAEWRDNIKDFSYSIRGNFATLKNKVTYIDPSLDRIAGTKYHTYEISYFEEGYPLYYFRGYKFTGIDPTTGNPTFADLNGDGQITADDDRTYIGDAIPDLTYGLTLTAAWKGIDFTLFGSGSVGSNIFHASYRPDQKQGNLFKEVFYDNRWTIDNPNGTVPSAAAADMDKYITSDAMIYDGSYFRIKQIQLGYSLPKTLLKKVFINNLRIYCSMEDFFTFTSYPGFDPEACANSISGMGIDKGGYPTPKKVMFGLNITF